MKIHDGRAHTDRLEINVVHHCNMSCPGCSHLSPVLPEYFLSPDRLRRDLSILSEYCRPERISLLGGEPLLHQDLPAIINAVRESGISNRIRVVTNGLLLHRMPEQFWESVDEVHVSLYPWHTIKTKQLAAFQSCARRNGTSLVLRYQNHFRFIYTEKPNMDDGLVRRIYRTCRVAREDCCHLLEDGYYYKCPQAALIPLKYTNCTGLSDGADGIGIRDGKCTAESLARYYASETPLAACRFCLGSVGRRFNLRQQSRQKPLARLSIEEQVDWKHLEKLERRTRLHLPAVSQSLSLKANAIISRLPASILLSATMRRIISAMSDVRHKYAV
jgi:organic radical activating enzyme